MSAPPTLPGEVWRGEVTFPRVGARMCCVAPHPDPDERDAVTLWAFAYLDHADPCGALGRWRERVGENEAHVFLSWARHERARAERAEAALAKIEEAKAHRRAKPRKCRACAHVARSGEGGEAPHTCERAKCGTCGECVSLAPVDQELPAGSYMHDTGDGSFDCDLDGNHGDELAADETAEEEERRHADNAAAFAREIATRSKP